MKKSALSKKIFFSIVLSISCITLVLLFLCLWETSSFHALTEKLFLEELSGSTLNLHYTLAYPEEYFPSGYQVILPAYSRESSLETNRSIETLLQKLSSFHPDRMPEKDAVLHRKLTRYLEQKQSMDRYLYYDDPLSPSSGAQSQLPILLAEYTFRTKRDVEDYLELLRQTDQYFSSLLTYEIERIDAGFGLSETSVEKVCEQCDSILPLADLKMGKHFLQSTFTDRLLPLTQSGVITAAEAEAYVRSNDQLLLRVLRPAYTNLKQGLSLLKTKDTPLTGLAAFPEGQEYYQVLLAVQTGSSRSISEIKTLLTEKLSEESQCLRELLTENPQAAALYRDGKEPRFPLTTSGEMLTDLKLRMSKDFPAVPGDLPGVAVKPVSKSLEPYSAPAFYLTSPLDATSENVIYINQSKTPKGLELYTTLAHEGFPGHLYQHVYSCRHLLEENDSPLHTLLWYGGYLEGWALYTEFLSYDYASQIYREASLEDAAIFTQIEKHSRSLQLCLYTLLDLKIHYDNYDENGIAPLLNQFGITRKEHHEAIFQYIAEEPANYPKYYLGYLEILSLRDKARAYWQESYSDLRFHTFLLEQGPADFGTLAEQLSGNSFRDR